MMRTFLVIGHEVRTDGRFNLNDLCGSTGRLDILLRMINSAFLISHGIRKNVDLIFVLQGDPDPPVSILLKGNELKYLNPDERSTGALIRQALLLKNKGNHWTRSTPGIYVSKRDYGIIVHNLRKAGGIPVYLHENGIDVNTVDIPSHAFFVFGDQYDLTEEEVALLGGNVMNISVGPTILHTDHCVVLLLNALDRREAPERRDLS